MKTRLFTPGPTPVPERVALRMAAPPIHHRTDEFRRMLARVHENLQMVFQTTGPVLPLTCSGTGAMEALMVNLLSPGDTVVTVNGGKFGARWAELARTYGLHAVELSVPWGTAVSPDQLRETLRAAPEARGVFLTHCETSTGTAIDLESLAAMVHQESGALLGVDGISSVGAQELRFDTWGIDACICGSQKGLMLPPGLAFVALSQRAAAAVHASTQPRFYFDLRRALVPEYALSMPKNEPDSGQSPSVGRDARPARGPQGPSERPVDAVASVGRASDFSPEPANEPRWMAAPDTPWTPATTLLTGADEALEMIRAEGLEAVWRRHARHAAAVRAAVTALGLRLFSSAPANALTAAWLPDGLPWKHLQQSLRTKSGVVAAGGQGEFAGKIFRVAHLGYYDDLDIVALAAALESALLDCGRAITPGAAVSAAQCELISSPNR